MPKKAKASSAHKNALKHAKIKMGDGAHDGVGNEQDTVVFVIGPDGIEKDEDAAAMQTLKSTLPYAITTPAVWEDKLHYEKYVHGEETTFKLEFSEILVPDCSIPINVQFFLDDTSNGDYGVGNTRFVDLQAVQSSTKPGVINQSMINVEWWMMGAKDGKVPMPNLGKIVVRGSTDACIGSNLPPNNINPFTGEVDGNQNEYCGILGGDVFSLDEMLRGLKEKGCFRITIYNSFLTNNDVDRSMPATPLQVCDVYLYMHKDVAAACYERFKTKKSHLFKESKLPSVLNNTVYNVAVQQLPRMMNQLFRERIKNGQYALPKNAPTNFLQLSSAQQDAILNNEPGGNIGRGGCTPSAELYGVHFLHATAAVTAMSKEDEQCGITSNLLLVHSFDAALAIFAPHGLTLNKLNKELDMQKAASRMLASFLVTTLNAVHSLPATQMYGFDNMIFRMPGKMAQANVGNAGWVCVAGENWQISCADSPFWSYKTSTGSISNLMDCETKASYVLRMLCHMKASFKAMSLDNIKDVMRGSVQQFFKDSIMERSKGASMSDTAYVQLYLHTISTFLDYVANKKCVKGELVLGKAYGAKKGSSVDQDGNDTRQAGGHAYPVITICTKHTGAVEQYVMGEGTAFVINRMDRSNDEQCKSTMMQQNAFCLLASYLHSQCKDSSNTKQLSAAGKCKAADKCKALVLNKTVKNTKPNQLAAYNGIMMQTELEHTDDFYGEALMSSTALLYEEHHELKTDMAIQNCIHGKLWFTKDEKTGQLSFGGCPENPYDPKNNVVFADIHGNIVDSMLVDVLKSSGSCAVSAFNPARISSQAVVQHPYTSLQQQLASAVRELAGRKVPKAHWEAWMNRMYVQGKPNAYQESQPDAVPFSEAGMLCSFSLYTIMFCSNVLVTYAPMLQGGFCALLLPSKVPRHLHSRKKIF
jgi:hypothetical protein